MLAREDAIIVRAERDRLTEKVRQYAQEGKTIKTIRTFNKRHEIVRLLLGQIDVDQFLATLTYEEDKKYYHALFNVKRIVYL